MPDFVWEGKTRSGDVRSGEVSAGSVEEVNQILRSSQINPTRVKRKATEIQIKLPGSSRAPGKNLVIFTRQFATMIDAGMPLVQCLELLGNAEPHAGFKATITEVRQDIEGGMSLADSMAKHPKTFTPLYTSLIAAGEVAGILDTVMSRLAGQLEKAAKLKRKVKGAFTYPTIVLVISIGVVIILLYKVIPTFSKMFEEMTQGEAGLPGPTVAVVAMSEFVQSNILFILGGLVLLFMLISYLLRNETTRRFLDARFLQLPLFGSLLRKVAVARFTRTLGTMVSSGVPIVDSLEIVSKTSGNYTVQDAILHVRQAISEGQNMVDPLTATGIFPDMVVQMIGAGEQTGALDTMLNKIADFYEEEVDADVENLTSLLEPIMMVGLGGVIGALLLAMYLPIFTLAGSIKTE